MYSENRKREITDKQKETTAITVMRCMITKYATEHRLSFEEAMFQFANSKAYEMLFDFNTDVWREGPDYLRTIFDEECNQTKVYIAPIV